MGRPTSKPHETNADAAGPADAAAGGVTLADVARLSGVSPITVSRALNQPNIVSEHTRERVMEAVHRLGYLPNLAAGSLVTRRSHLVAALVPSISTLMFARMIESFEARLREHGYEVILGVTNYDIHREEQLLQTILRRRPDAVFLTGVTHTAQSRSWLLGSGIPVVETWDLTRSPIDMLIGFSHEEIGRATARFLLSKGYRRFGLLTTTEERAQLREKGLIAELRAHPDARHHTIHVLPPTTLRSGRAGLSELLETDFQPDAVVCSSDSTAHGAIVEAIHRGCAVPGQLAVMGFGDMTSAADIEPSLSTVRIDPAMIGATAAQALLDKLERGGHAERVVDLGFEICARAST
ncbi:LacI family DNA-binding transcriptional regulator [Burkholderia sp. Ac-20379]|uniref:LacI family DNA-binding transcriptional regulator n=1 Tax=Burkholderia sp. Ac-20379 TaxID=2703900 RepID=UPI00197E4488|nr:LacI family DNA-binding transcriptional regulator [Burkholderia sp. Ac-20379]MBN3723577.1 LacI family DNA-binding transcriptional regulator [Burkholderia sp. Ac-20379]